MKKWSLRNNLYLTFLVIATFTPLKINAKIYEDAKNFLGRWDINVISTGSGWANRARFCWLELKVENDTLKGRLQPGEGMTVDITDIKIENGELTFRPINQTKAIWRCKIKGDQLKGTATSSIFGKETRSWTGTKGPKWSEKLPVRKPGKPVDLIDKDVSGWLLQDPNRPIGWFVKDGILQNLGQQANNIYSKQKFRDFKIDAEFKVDPKSNSGIYLRGRYEIQIMDNFGSPMNVHSQGALYGYIVPPVNACKPSGEWQTFEITIIANRVTVILNGTMLYENGDAPGITGGALDSNEEDPGPIMIQGDHGKVQFRKFIVTPLI